MTTDNLTSLLAEVGGLRVRTATVEGALERVAQVALRVLAPCDGCSVTVRTPGGDVRTAVATSDTVREIDRIEYSLDQGPCMDAMRTRTTHRSADLRADERWPTFAEHTLRHGVHGAAGVPLVVDGTVLGALNLYCSEPGVLDALGDNELIAYAALTAATVDNVNSYQDAVQLAEQLREAMTSRAVIEQAKGVLMAQRRCGADDAFAVLAAASQRENVKLRDLAGRIVQGVHGLAPG